LPDHTDTPLFSHLSRLGEADDVGRDSGGGRRCTDWHGGDSHASRGRCDVCLSECHLVFRVSHFARFKAAKGFSFFFQKEALVSCSFLKKKNQKTSANWC
jgi:hypothetical protein